MTQPPTGMQLSSKRILAALAAITLVAAGLRLAGISCGLPHMSDPDNVIVRQARRLEVGDAGIAPKGRMPTMYPMLFARALHHLPGKLQQEVEPGWDVEQHKRNAARPYALARTMIALLSMLVVPGTYLLARRFLPPAWALFAASLAATSLLHSAISRQARPHGAVTTFVLLATVAALWMARSGSLASCTVAGLAAALAVASLHNGAAVLPALAVAALLVLRRGGLRAWPRLIPPLALPLAAALAFYPGLLQGDLMGTRDFGGQQVLTGAGFGRSVHYLWGADPVLFVLALVGLIAGARTFLLAAPEDRKTHETLVVAAFALSYFAAIGMYYSTWPRFLTPLVPVLACLGAAGAASLASRLPRGRALAPALAVSLLALPTYAAARWAWLHTRPHTLDVAARWVEENTEAEKEILFVSLLVSPAVLESRKSLAGVPPYARSPFQKYLLENQVQGTRRLIPLLVPSKRRAPKQLEPADLVEVMESENGGGDYALLFAPGEREFMAVAVEAVQAHGGQLLERIQSNPTLGPDAGFGANRKLGRYRALAVALTAQAIGPEIDVYRLP